jgi:hypothetical protein
MISLQLPSRRRAAPDLTTKMNALLPAENMECNCELLCRIGGRGKKQRADQQIEAAL